MIKIHACPFRKNCRMAGIVWRFHFHTLKWNFGIAFRPKDKFVGKIDMEAWRKRHEVIRISKDRWTRFVVAPREVWDKSLWSEEEKAWRKERRWRWRKR